LLTGCLVALVGTAHVVLGVDAVARSHLHGVGAGYTYYIDIAPWGWIHVACGALLVLAGVALLLRRPRARALGLVLALVSAVVAILLVAYDPGRSLVLVALDVAVVWALCRVAP
jgi:hypothetical protein